MTLRDALRTLGWIAGTVFPQQAVRVLVGRDYDAAVRRVDDALAVAEERSEVLEPSDFPLCNCESAQAADLDDHRPACAARAADSPAVGERTPDNRPTAGRTPDPRVFDRDAYMAGLKFPEKKPVVENTSSGTHTWYCAECGKAMHTVVAAVSKTRPGHFCSVRCADGETPRQAELRRVMSALEDAMWCYAHNDMRGNCKHLETCCDTRPFTPDDLAAAARIIDYTADLMPDQDDPVTRYRRALAGRLFREADKRGAERLGGAK